MRIGGAETGDFCLLRRTKCGVIAYKGCLLGTANEDVKSKAHGIEWNEMQCNGRGGEGREGRTLLVFMLQSDLMEAGAGITRLAMLPLEFHGTLSCSGLHCVECSGGGEGWRLKLKLKLAEKFCLGKHHLRGNVTVSRVDNSVVK